MAPWTGDAGGAEKRLRMKCGSHFGLGYRIYLGFDGAELVILLGGSARARQNAAIANAQERWTDDRRRKRRGEQESC